MTVRELRVALDAVPEEYMDLGIFAISNIGVGAVGHYVGYIDLTGGGWIDLREEE